MILFSLCISLAVDKIRGVSPANAGQYRRAISIRKNTFTCFDKSKTISMDQVNDGYCDCPDGSDEPGTNACGTGEFYCRNTGSVPKLIPKWMVNDGVCDCCDGSDEAGNPHANCEDLCGAIRRRSIQFRSNLTNMTVEMAKVRSKYSERGRLELTVRRKQLSYVESQKVKVFKAADLVEKIYWDVKSGGEPDDLMRQLNLTMYEIKTEFKELEKTEKSLRKGYRKVKQEVPHYGRFNLKNRATLHFNVENCICWLQDFSSVFMRLRTAYEISKSFFKAFLRGDVPPKPTAGFNKLGAITSKIENYTKKVTDLMAIDFGPDKEFLPLYRQWYYYEKDDWYVEFYPYNNCTRRHKKDSNNVFNCGSYNKSYPLRWYFNNGQICDTRMPAADLEVRLHCYPRDQILSFKEWEKCRYKMDFGTPTACVDDYKRFVDSMDDVSLDEWAKDAGLF